MYKVIVVDDEFMIKRGVCAVIERGNCGFICAGEANDGREALQLCREVVPDVVITDICMPVMDGLELVEALSGQYPVPKIVILSGYDEFEYAQKALRLGVDDYLLKPLDPDALQELLVKLACRLGAESRSTLEKGRLFDEIGKRAKRLSEAVWAADGGYAREVLEEIRVLLGDAGEAVSLRELYMYLLFRTDSELVYVSGRSLLNPDRIELPNHSEPLAKRVTELVDEAIGQIRASKNWNGSHTVAKAVDYIHRHYKDNELTLQDIAGQLGMNLSYLSRAIKEETGVTFVHYLTELRLSEAKERLMKHNAKIYETAAAVGYKDYSHFAKAFRKRFGCSPTEFLKMSQPIPQRP
jgi:two-component system response regulator YesN